MRSVLKGALVGVCLAMQCHVGLARPSDPEVAGGAAALARLSAEILQHPQNTALNLRYAALAERLGETRLALAAYERILIYDPYNAAALEGLGRVRKEIAPNTTQYVAGLGLIYESNPTYVPSTFAKGEAQEFGYLNVRDERTLRGLRWRTNANVNGTLHDEQDQLDYGVVRATTGPLLELLPGLTVRPALGAGASVFDGRFFYGEGIGSLTFEAYPNGAYQSITIRGALRDYNSYFVPDNTGGYVEAMGKFTSPVAPPNMALSVTPWVRWAQISGPLGAAITATAIQPGDYTEVGGQFNAFWSLSNQFSTAVTGRGPLPYVTKARAKAAAPSPVADIIFGANILVSQRYYRDQPVAGGTTQRQDTTVSPGASLIFAHLFQYQNTLRLDYSYIHDNSNDTTKSFDDHVVTLTAIRSF